MRGCEVRRLTDNTVPLRLSRSDQIANYETRWQHASLQWSTDFNHRTSRDSRSTNTPVEGRHIEIKIGAGQKNSARDVTIKDVRRTAA
jgi:hypothetical protein